jgi:hypothetical protein
MSWYLRSAALRADGPRPVHAPKRVGRPPIEVAIGLNLVMPAQWFPDRGAQARLQPEKRLMLAVLEDVVDILVRYRGGCERKQQLRREAEEWVDSDDRESPFAFLNLCDALGLEPDCVRRGLARFRDEHDCVVPPPPGVPGGTDGYAAVSRA